MRTIHILTAIIFCSLQTLLLSGCKKETSNFSNTFVINNPTGFDVVALNTKTKERSEIKKGSTITISTNESIDLFNILGDNSDDRKYLLEVSSQGKYTIYSYEFELEYKCSRTSSTAKVSFLDDQGAEKTILKVDLPYSIGYRVYRQKKYYLNIENLDMTGFVTIEVLYKGKPVRESLSAPHRAGTSGNIDN